MAHYNHNLDDLGQTIQNVVDTAVNSQNYQQLNQHVHQVVDRPVCKPADNIRRNPATAQDLDRLYSSTAGTTLTAILKLIFGLPLATVALLVILGGTVEGKPLLNYPGPTVFFAAMMALGWWMAYSGLHTLNLISRYKAYRRTLGFSTCCSLAVLASSAGRSIASVRKDLQWMLRKGLFPEGHLNQEETHLLTSHEAFQKYSQTRQPNQRASINIQSKPASQNPQVQEILNKGNAFIAQLRACNDAIPGQEISEKISRIELIVQRIFERVSDHPQIVPDLKKLMEYYLPMTIKLLSAYADMDAQPIQGATIQSSKKEIEATLDTLNLAFERLLDDLFMETAMDVSSDISVLNTLLAQEGLTGDDFPSNNNI